MLELFTAKETAAMLRINYRKVLDMIHLKIIGAYKIGGDYRVPIHEIHKYLEKVRTK
ncbi:helix-turn-helix domain-containing protein [Candidatus Neomarinimicrobiota bacterium]